MDAQASTEHGAAMPIAIIGMSCRLPGDVSTLEDFWELLSRARGGWCEIPEDRFTTDAYQHPNAARKGTFNARGGYFLKQDPALFDAPFFNITHQEAEAMDPQQRLLLECAYEAFENAGIPKEDLVGQNVGVFVGGSTSDYRLSNLHDLEQTPMFDATGNHQSILAGRISHYFDLRGPSFTIDTACSSSLYALHQAMQSIRTGESQMAVVAACHLNLHPGDWVSMSLQRLFSDQGVTYAFDNRAKSGFARGEGAGCLILKPLADATRDNDKIRSVIVNSGTNQDGRTVGITSPNGKAQEQLMREVYAHAGIRPEDVGFVEAHGTGTKVGDPIEATAIYNVFGQTRTPRQPLYLGSVKSNVGHLENASGIVSVIKGAMMLEKGFILPNINFETPNENIPLKQWNMRVPTSQRPWPATKRYLSVNNFGFGGSNAHCVIEKAPLELKPNKLENFKPAADDGKQRLFVLSANDEASARKSMDQISIYLEQHPEVFQKALTRNLAYTLCQRRSHLAWRVALPAFSSIDLGAALSHTDTKPTRSSHIPKIAFVYTGQGAQWYAMGRELMESYPIFAETMRATDSCVKGFGADFSVLEELSRDKETTQVDKAHISQTVCTALQVALTELLKSWGVSPSSVTGHSSGEIGAAYAAGALTLESAMAIAYYRGQAVVRLQETYPDLRGSMLAVGASPEEVKSIVKLLRNGVAVVACENSPSSITASGDESAIDELAAEIESRQIFNRKLRVDVAYHSAHMKLVADTYHAAIGDLEPLVPSENVGFYSSLHGKKADVATLDASYWVDNLTCPVRFSTSLLDLVADSTPDVIVEVGPHSALEGPIKQVLKGIGQQASKTAYFTALARNKDATTTAMKLAADLYMKGQPLNFGSINHEDEQSEPPMLLADLTPYPWSRQRYWHESRLSSQHRKKPFPRHDLLGVLADFSNNELAPTWRNVIRTDDLPWLRDHKMQSLTTFPFAGFVSMAVEAAAQRASMRGNTAFERFILREIQVKRPLLLDDDGEYELVLSMAPYAEGTRSFSDDWDDFRIWSWQQDKGWTEHCRGLISARKGGRTNLVNSSQQGLAARKLQAAGKACGEDVSSSVFYDELEKAGATYGPVFRSLGDIKACEGQAVGTVTLADTVSTMPEGHQTSYMVHPSLLDPVFQVSFPILGAGRSSGMSTLYMPCNIRELQLSRNMPTETGKGVHVVAYGEPDLENPKNTEFSMEALLSPDDQDSVISMSGLLMCPVKGEGEQNDAPRELCFKLEWEPANGTAQEAEGPVDGTESQSINAEGDEKVPQLDLSLATESSSPIQGSDSSGQSPTSSVHMSADFTPFTEIASPFEASASKASVVIVTDGLGSDALLASLKMSFLVNNKLHAISRSLSDVEIQDDQRVIISELDKPILSELDAEKFSRIQKLLTQSAGVLWVTKGAYLNATNPTSSMSLGLTRTIRSETAAKVATLDLDPESQLKKGGQVDLILETFGKVFDSDEQVVDMEFAEKDGALFVPRISNDDDMNLFVHRELHDSEPYPQEFDAKNGRRLKMAIGTTGALDTLYFREDEPTPLGDHDVEIQVAATGMNFKDVVIAMGQLPNPYLGIECAGTVSSVGSQVDSLAAGDRVCAMSLGAYSTFTRCPATSAAKIPASMSFEVAASIPVVYCTAYYALVEQARLEKGEKVLIHAAAGGVGQAAIQLAQMVGADIYATVGTPDKKKFIMETYGIPEARIFSSRDTSFAAGIREATGGEGVDVVLNSLAGDFLRQTWDCVAHFGRFIEIGKRDITSNTRLEMAPFEHNATFSSVDLSVLAAERPKNMARTFDAVMKLFTESTVKPIAPITVYGVGEIESAFRLLQSGKTMGKLVVVPEDGEKVKAVHPKNSGDLLRGDATYAIIGGTGGLGRSMTKWMVGKGARNVVLLSRSGRLDGQVAELIKDLHESAGANIVVKACDVADADSVAQLVSQCTEELPPIRGVIHAGMVLRDVLFETMTFTDYDEVIRSKVAGAWNMHNALLSTPLDFFIAISSAAGIVGNRGQAAYAAANTFLDAFAQYRQRLGMPASAIDLTAVEDIGYLAETSADRQKEVMQNLGGAAISGAEVLALVMAAMRGDMGMSCGNHCLTGLKLESDSELPYFADDAKFTHLRDAALANSSLSSTANTQAVSIATSLSRAPTPEAALEIVVAGVGGKLGAILMVAAEDMDASRPITAYGLDSLNAIELRNWITKELGVGLQVLELLTSGSLTSLGEMLLKKRAAAAK